MKKTACALALLAILPGVCAFPGGAAPIFDGSTLNRTAPAADAGTAGQDGSAPEAKAEEQSARPERIFAGVPQAAAPKQEQEQTPAPDTAEPGERDSAARAPAIGKSPEINPARDAAFALPKEGNVFLNAKADSARVKTSIASLLGIDLDPKHRGDPAEMQADLAKLKEVLKVAAPLPVRSLIAVEANGNLVLMSENQRFIIKGTVYDAFNNMKELKTADEIRQYAYKTDYRRLGLDPETLNSARIGTGPLNVVIYSDPLSKHTHDLMTEAMSLPDLENYSFYFVIMPSPDPKSKDAALRFYCAREEGNPEAGNLLYQGKLDTLTQTECDSAIWDRTMSAAYYTGVDVVPFFVGVDGSLSRGIPAEGMANWVAATVPVDLAPLRDLKVKKQLEENITERALNQDAQAEIEEKQEAQEEKAGTDEPPANPFADTPLSSAADAASPSPLEADDGAWREFTDRKLKARADTLHERYVKDLDRLKRAEERSRTRYEKTLQRTEGALKQARSYSDEKRQQAVERLNHINDSAYEQHQEKLREIAEQRGQVVKDYRADLQALREQQAELKGE